jgi:hypothetical protein
LPDDLPVLARPGYEDEHKESEEDKEDGTNLILSEEERVRTLSNCFVDLHKFDHFVLRALAVIEVCRLRECRVGESDTSNPPELEQREGDAREPGYDNNDRRKCGTHEAGCATAAPEMTFAT